MLRVFSVALVIFSHYGLLRNFPLGGTHGVAIFFMVSGYCMGYSTQNRSGAEFLAARYWRLIPTLVVCATVTTLIEAAIPYAQPDRLHSVKDYLANLLCLPTGNILCDTVYFLKLGKSINYNWVDGAYWSLLVEIRFYLLLWFLYYFFRIQRIHFIISALGMLAVLNLSSPYISKSQDFFLYLSFFGFGMAYRSWINGDRLSLISLVIALATFLSNGYFGAEAVSMSLNLNNLINYLACFMIFIFSLLVFSKKRNKIIGYVGVLSYPLYLLHQDIGLILISIMRDHVAHFYAAVTAIIIIFIISALVQISIEAVTPRMKRGASRLYLLFSTAKSS